MGYKDARKMSPPPEFDSRTVESVASGYTCRAMPVPMWFWNIHKIKIVRVGQTVIISARITFAPSPSTTEVSGAWPFPSVTSVSSRVVVPKESDNSAFYL